MKSLSSKLDAGRCCDARAVVDAGRVDTLNEKQINSLRPTDAMIVVS